MSDQTEKGLILTPIPPAEMADGDVWINSADGCFNVFWGGSCFHAEIAGDAVRAAIACAVGRRVCDLRDRLATALSERDEARAIDEVWREETNRTLDEERARSQRYRERQSEAERQRDEARAQARKIGEECHALQAQIDAQARTIAALHVALADALGIPA